MEITEETINNRYNTNVYVNNPNKISDIQILHKINIRNGVPFFSIIVPICNQESIIVKHIKSILDKTTVKEFELILIIDCCSDRTEEYITSWINNNEKVLEDYKLLTNILVLKSTIPLFEVAADNLGFFCSRGKYCLEIQADMEMTDEGYNMRLLQPFLLNDNIIGISGRCTHDFTGQRGGVGKLGFDISIKVKDLPNVDADYYYIGETCNRGPLLFDKEKLKTLKYLDEANYFLENDEHDLFARAYVEHGWRCGYVPIDFIALLENGTMRKKRDALNQEYYDKFRRESTKHDGFLYKNVNTIQIRDITKHKLYI
jgi:glycosyltransferase involved in cell wall biosynthesis